MLNLIKYVVLGAALVMSGTIHAACEKGFCVSPYIAVDYGVSHLHVKNSPLTDHLKPKGIQVSGGLNFNEYFGVEMGVHHAHDKSNGNHHRFHGGLMTAMGYMPITKNVSIFSGAGVHHLKSVMHDKEKKRLNVDISKIVPRVVGGAQCMFTENVGIRAGLAWENTARLKHPKLKSGNSLVYSAGLILAL